MRSKGFTVVELMVVVAILSIVTVLVLCSVGGQGTVSWGWGGAIASRCIEGYKYTIDSQGQARQVLSELGKGVACK